MTSHIPPNARFTALYHRNFTLLWTGLLVSNIGTWMQNVAQAWLVLQITNSPLWLGLLGLSFAIPMIALPLLGGVVVDRVHRIRLLYITQTGMLLNALILAILTWTGVINVWHILITSFIGSVLLAFDNPARQALIPDLVPPRDLLNALSLNSATYNGAALVGPAIAGALLAPLGAGSLFFLNSVSYIAVIIALLFLRGARTHSGGTHRSLGESVTRGLSFALRDPMIRVLLLLSVVASFFGRSYQMLLPAFAQDIFHSGSEGYGILLSSAGAGALIGAFGLAWLREIKKQGALLIASGLVFGFVLVGFAECTTIGVGAGLLLVVGITSTAFGTIIATFLQLLTPDELRGRVMSLYAITLIGVPSLGALISGSVAQALGGVQGSPRAVLIGAIIVVAVLTLVTRRFWFMDSVVKPVLKTEADQITMPGHNSPRVETDDTDA